MPQAARNRSPDLKIALAEMSDGFADSENII
jgi:hypothetical protein